MFNKETLETTEFYRHRFQNFSTRIILPATVALLLAILFLFLAKREVTITSTGELTPAKQVVSLQTTTSSRIIDNHLKEGKAVKKGDTLLTYHDVNNPTQLKVFQEQEQQLKSQLAALDQFKTGITNNQDSFNSDDSFGYRQALKDYLTQRQIYTLGSQQITGSQHTNNDKAAKVNALLAQSISTSNQNIAAYQTLQQAIQNSSGYDTNAPFSYLYKSFESESKGLTGDELAKVKSTYISQISEKLDSERANLASLKLQQANNETDDVSQLQVAENDQKVLALQASQLKSVADQRTQAQQSLTELSGKIAVLKDQTTDFTVKAPASGTLHLDESLQGKKYLPSGSTLAEIYPVMTEQTKVSLALAVSPTDITSIRKGQRVRLQISRNVPVPLTLNGTIEQIDVAPTITKAGNVFMVKARVPLTARQARMLHYGLSGRVSIITGKKTYFNFLKDRLLNQS